MNRILDVLGGASLLALMVAAAPAVAQEAPVGGSFTSYIALGDSYSSGVGATVMNPDPCRTSSAAWPLVLAGKIGNPAVVHPACSGATTQDVMEGMGPKNKQQGGIAQIDRLPPADQLNGALITIQIGGNDLGYSERLVECLEGVKNADGTRGPRPEGCPGVDEVYNRSKEVIDNLALRLDYVYRGLRAAAPNATIVAIGYPHLVSGSPTCSGLTGGFLPLDTRQKFNALVDAGNAQMKATAEMAGIGAITDEIATAFEGHEMCSTAEWLVTPETAPGYNILLHAQTKQYLEPVGHPTDEGHRQIADLVFSLLPNVPTRNGTVTNGGDVQPEGEPGGLPEGEPVGVPEEPVGVPEGEPVGVPEEPVGVPEEPVEVPEEPVGVPGDEVDDQGVPGNDNQEGIPGDFDDGE